MQRRRLITGLAGLAGGLGAGRLLAQDSARSATGAGSCQLITQDVTGPFHVDRYPDRSNLIDGQNGRAQFVTAFPGWYFPRATHLHLKVYPPDFGEEATTQLYFRNAICDEVYALDGYKHRGPNPTRRSPGDKSGIFSFESDDLWLNISKSAGGYEATHELGVVFYGGMFGELTDFYRQG